MDSRFRGNCVMTGMGPGMGKLKVAWFRAFLEEMGCCRVTKKELMTSGDIRVTKRNRVR